MTFSHKLTWHNKNGLRLMGLDGFDMELGEMVVGGKRRLRVTYFNVENNSSRVFHTPLSCDVSANAVARYIINHFIAGTLDRIEVDKHND